MFSKKSTIPAPQTRQPDTKSGQSALFDRPAVATQGVTPHAAPPRPVAGGNAVGGSVAVEPAIVAAPIPKPSPEKESMTQYPTKQAAPTFRGDFRNEPRGDARSDPARRVDLSGTPSPRFSDQDPVRKLVVGRDISLNAEISACDYLVVEGTVDARMPQGRRIEIAETGSFKGSVEIEEADIAGRFEGDMIVRGRLRVRATGSIRGKVQYGELEIESGGRIDGQIASLKPEAAEVKVQARSPAITQGKPAEILTPESA